MRTQRSEGNLYSFFNLGTRWGCVVEATLLPLYPGKRPGTHFVGGWVGPRVGLYVCRKSHPNRDSIPGPSSPSQVAMQTTLSALL